MISFSKQVFTLLLFSLISFDICSQNLAPNPSFEIYAYCPVGVGAVGNLPATPWRSATNGTPDYFHECAVFPAVGVPLNGFGYQFAHTGVAYMGGILSLKLPDSSSYREYLMAQLLGPGLQAGYTYQVSFYVSLGDSFCALDKIGAYFSQNRPPGSIKTTLNVEPQIESDLGIITDSVNWVLISGCFIAAGGERWITIGNFYDNDHTTYEPSVCIDNYSYYFIDDVEVLKIGLPDTFAFDLGAPTESCSSYLINPTLHNVEYLWNNGSQDSTLLVTESGTYSVTITSRCAQGVDSIEVIIEKGETIDIGPPEIYLCTGDSLRIFLDPDLGQYAWQDGSIGNEYLITSNGLYQVTLNPGSCETTDEMLVHSISPPILFSLGNDTSICPGVTLFFSPGISDVDYFWQDGSTASTLNVQTADSIILLLSNECGERSDTLIVSVLLPPPDFDLGADTIICPGQSFLLQAPPTASTIQWQDGSSNSSLLVDKAQIYSLVLTNDCGFVSDELSVGFDDNIPVLHLDPVKTACPGELISLDATQLFPVTYQWNTGAITPSIVVNDIGTYSVEIQAPCSTVHDETEIILADTCFAENSFFVPNVFSPNGDNINDVFRISLSDGIEVHSMQASIFDRWGNMVFSSTTIPLEWDGGFSGKPLNPGVYAYRIEMNYFDRVTERKVILHGDVTLIR